MDVFNLTIDLSSWQLEIFKPSNKDRNHREFANFITIVTEAFGQYYLTADFAKVDETDRIHSTLIHQTLVQYFQKMQAGIMDGELDWSNLHTPFQIIHFSDHYDILEFTVSLLTKVIAAMAISDVLIELHDDRIRAIDEVFQVYNFSRDLFEVTYNTHFAGR